MANWLEAAFGLGEEAEPIAPPPKPRQAPEVKGFICVVAQPTGAPGDLGETVDSWYYVKSGMVTLCDRHGRPITKSADDRGSLSAVLAPNDEPRRVASRLRRAAWQKEEGRSAFDRPLHYQPFDVA